MGLMPTAPAATPGLLPVTATAGSNAAAAGEAGAGSSPFAALLVAMTASLADSTTGGQPKQAGLPGAPAIDVPLGETGDTSSSESEAAILAASQLIAAAMPLDAVPSPLLQAATAPEVIEPAATTGASGIAASPDAILPSLPDLNPDDRPKGAFDIKGMEPVAPATRQAKVAIPGDVEDLPAPDNDTAPLPLPIGQTELPQPLGKIETTMVRSFVLPASLDLPDGTVLPVEVAPSQPSLPGQPPIEPGTDGQPPLEPSTNNQPPVESAPLPPTSNQPPTGEPPLEPPGASALKAGVVRIDGNANTSTTRPAAPAPTAHEAGVTQAQAAKQATVPVVAEAPQTDAAPVAPVSQPQSAAPASALNTTTPAPGAVAVNAAAVVANAAPINVSMEPAARPAKPEKNIAAIHSTSATAIPLEPTSDSDTSEAATLEAAAPNEAFMVPAPAAATTAPSQVAIPLAADDDRTKPVSATSAAPTVAVSPAATPAPRNDALAPANETPAPTAAPTTETPQPAQQVAAAVLDKLETGGGEARLHLQPRELGDVVIHIRTNGERVDVSVRAERAEAVAMLRDNVNELTGLLGERGLNLADLNVSLGMQQQNRGGGWEPTALPNNSRRSNGEFSQLLGNDTPSAAGTHRRLQAAYNPDGAHIYRI